MLGLSGLEVGNVDDDSTVTWLNQSVIHILHMMYNATENPVTLIQPKSFGGGDAYCESIPVSRRWKDVGGRKRVGSLRHPP